MDRNPLQCKRCGCFAVEWRQTKAARWYLSVRDLSDSMDASARAYAAAAGRRPHRCDSHLRHSADLEAHQAAWTVR